MSVFFTHNFLSNAHALQFQDSASVVWSFDPTTNQLSATVAVGTPGIADNAVTNAKLADMAQATIKGRASGAGTGDPADLTAAQVKTILAIAPADVNFAATSRVLGRITAGAGAGEELTGANIATIIGTALGANPSANVGLAAVNGTAGTYMRSDAAPALNQAIAPTWTGAHTFTPGAGVAITINAKAGSTGISLKAGGTTDIAMTFNGQAAGQTVCEYDINGTAKMYLGVAGAASQVIVGSAANDAVLRTQGGNILFSLDSGASIGCKLTSTAISFKGATAGALVDMTPDKGSFTATLTGGYVSNPTGTLNWVRMGNLVCLYSTGNIVGTSNATTQPSITGIPAAITPTAAVNHIYCGSLEDNSVTSKIGACVVQSSGVFPLYLQTGAGAITTTWTGANLKGITAGWCIVYPIA